jgi:subtilisin
MAVRRYIVMPAEGWRSPDLRLLAESASVARIASAARDRPSHPLKTMPPPPGLAAAYEVVSATAEDAPKLVVMTPETARYLNRASPLTVEPNAPVAPAVRPAMRVRKAPGWQLGGRRRRLRVVVRDEQGRPIAGARVVALEEPAGTTGLARRTRVSGTVVLDLPADMDRLPVLRIEPPAGHVGSVLADVAGGEVAVTIRRSLVDAYVDGLRRRIGAPAAGSGAGARVAVIDSGVDAGHPDLAHVICRSVVDDQHGAFAHHHGTHVAGILGGRGAAGMLGVAPAAGMWSWRVVALGAWKADIYSLGVGIEEAARSNMHLINISMTTRRASDYLGRAASIAWENGAICIAAAGNEGQRGIAFPAAGKRVAAVTAYADRGGLPPDSPDLADVTDELAQGSPHLSRARFSNWGPEADFIGPGVGIISCAPGGSFAVSSGTSMASPAVTGLAAALLSARHPEVLAMDAGPARAAAITGALPQAAEPLGFSFEVQGNGIVGIA